MYLFDKWIDIWTYIIDFHFRKWKELPLIVNWTMIWPCCVQARLMMVHTASILSKLFSALFSARTNPGKNIIFPQHQLYDPWQAAGPLFSNTVTPICSLQVSAKYSGVRSNGSVILDTVRACLWNYTVSTYLSVEKYKSGECEIFKESWYPNTAAC